MGAAGERDRLNHKRLGGKAMFEQQKILNKIEAWVEKLPYRSVKIEVELANQTLVLTKDRQRQIGFCREEVKK